MKAERMGGRRATWSMKAALLNHVPLDFFLLSWRNISAGPHPSTGGTSSFTAPPPVRWPRPLITSEEEEAGLRLPLTPSFFHVKPPVLRFKSVLPLN